MGHLCVFFDRFKNETLRNLRREEYRFFRVSVGVLEKVLILSQNALKFRKALWPDMRRVAHHGRARATPVEIVNDLVGGRGKGVDGNRVAVLTPKNNGGLQLS